jgi:hypothetical protein
LAAVIAAIAAIIAAAMSLWSVILTNQSNEVRSTAEFLRNNRLEVYAKLVAQESAMSESEDDCYDAVTFNPKQPPNIDQIYNAWHTAYEKSSAYYNTVSIIGSADTRRKALDLLNKHEDRIDLCRKIASDLQVNDNKQLDYWNKVKEELDQYAGDFMKAAKADLGIL